MSLSASTILHIDDREEHRYVVRRILEKSGFRCLSAASGEEGLERIAEEKPDLVILDISLPRMNGYEVCLRIKGDEQTSGTPVLHLSSHYTAVADRVSGLDGGADGYLLFPVEAVELVAQVRALLRIRASEERFRFLADALPQKVWTADSAGQRNYMNRRWSDYTGVAASHGLGLKWLDFVHADDRSDLERRWKRAVESHEAFEVEVRLRRHDGVFRWHLCQAVPMEAGPEATQWFGTCTDVETHKVAQVREAFLSEAQELLSSTLDAPRVLSGLSRLAVPRVADSFVVPLRESLPQREGDTTLAEVFETGCAHVSPARICVPVFGRHRAIVACVDLGARGPRVFAEDDHAFAVGFAARVAVAVENARLYREAKRANQAKDEFLANVSHELRSPLSVLVGYSSLLASGDLPPEEFRASVEAIHRNALMQSRLVEDLLDVSRINTGTLSLARESLDVAEILRVALEAVSLAARSKGVEVRQEGIERVGAVQGDRTRLQQVAWNLLTNAIKFTPRGGSIDVRLVGIEGSAELTVSDSGSGIEPDFLPFVFERFRQEDAGTTRQFGGLGLGLAIVRQIVEAHGGTVEVASAGRGRGAVFTVRLPLEEGDGAPDTAGNAHTPALSAPTPLPLPAARVEPPVEFVPALQPLAGVSIVVIDDLDDSREFLAYALERAGASVLPFPSARSALAFLAAPATEPTVVLCDLSMPENDGFDFLAGLESLRAHAGAMPAPPVIALTAHARPEDKARCRAAGFKAHVSKPIAMPSLFEAIASFRTEGARR